MQETKIRHKTNQKKKKKENSIFPRTIPVDSPSYQILIAYDP